MANKKKVSGNNKVKSNGDSNSGSGSSNIFETLFGDAPEQKGSVSIFSADNPFRRKSSNHAQTPHHHQQQQHQKQQVGLGFSSAEAVRNTTTSDNEIPNPAEVTKRKRNKEKNSNLDSGSLDDPLKTPLETKKSRKFEPKSSNLGVNYGERGGGQSSDLGFDSKGSLKRGKGRKHNLSPESKVSLESGNGKEPNLRLATDELPKQKEGKNLELNGTLTLEKKEALKKKKRKRDEVETEYEARHYGVVATNVEGGEGGLGRKLVGEKRKNLDDPVDMMVSKEGFDNEAKLLRTVFVGNLPLKVKKKALFKDFRQFGEVESVRIRSVPLGNTKRPRKGAIIQKEINGAVDSVHAYVVFKTEEAAQASLAHNMAVVEGNHIRVDRACPPRKKLKGEDAPLYDNKRTLFVGNLPFDVKDEEIYQLFSGIKDLESSIEGIRVIRDPGTSMGKGIAYILFKTRGAANLLAKKRSLKLRDRELRLSHSRSNATPSKRKSPSPWEGNESPSKKLKADPKTPVSDSKVKSKADSSYQGLRASKSGVQKKVNTRVIQPAKFTTGTPKGEKLKERNGKRPSVAARKANALNGGGSSKQNGKKRKMESRTPESAPRPNKKTRKFR